MSMDVWHKVRANTRYENKFTDYLMSAYKNITIINQNPDLDPDLLNVTINAGKLLASLESDNYLSSKRRTKCIEILRNLDCDEIQVALEISKVSFDYKIYYKDTYYYLELHEEQHRNLKDSRLKNIFCDSMPIKVPRYLQRLVRDCWRLKCAKEFGFNYTIIWFDYLNKHGIPKDFLSPGIHEYYLPGKFSFEWFM
jgi:hypothetical protein